MIYGHREYPFAKAFADALDADGAFRNWVLSRTKFFAFSKDASLLANDMRQARTGKPKVGRETDLLAIFQHPNYLRTKRFALHVEVKRPGDSFKDSNQALAYKIRAKCWVKKPPSAVLLHSDSSTMLLFSESDRWKFSPDLKHFASSITFEEIKLSSRKQRSNGRIHKLNFLEVPESLHHPEERPEGASRRTQRRRCSSN